MRDSGREGGRKEGKGKEGWIKDREREGRGEGVELDHLGPVPQSLSQFPWEVERVRNRPG